jgi:hypothetical protein
MLPSDKNTDVSAEGAITNDHASSMAETLDRIEALPWGDLGPAILIVRDVLEYAMLISRDAFATWENELADKVFSSEFDVPVEVAVELPVQQRLGHLARLTRSLAMAYGVRTDVALPPDRVLEEIGEIQPDSPAWILDQLDRAIAQDA